MYWNEIETNLSPWGPVPQEPIIDSDRIAVAFVFLLLVDVSYLVPKRILPFRYLVVIRRGIAVLVAVCRL